MAFSDLGSLGATGSTANNQATLVLTTAAVAAVGELVVLVIADDNQGSGADGDGGEVSSITDNSAGGPNTWLKAKGFANNNAAAQAGAAVQIWYSVITHQIANAGTITITFASSTLSDATGVTARHFSFASGATINIEATNTLADDAADPGALDATTRNMAALRIRGIAGEVGNNTSLTVTANWTGWANGNSATSGTTAEMCARAEHHISTGTGDSSNPTWTSQDNASAYVAFIEFIQTTIQPTSSNLALSSVAPDRLYARIVDAPSSNLALSSVAPDRLVSDHKSISVPSGNALLSTVAPDISRGTCIEVPQANLALTSDYPDVDTLGRHWVGGTANWDGTAGSKWALQSGARSGATVPGTTEDAIFDGNSGTGTITISGTRNARDFDTNGFAGAFSGASTPILNVSGTTFRIGSNVTLNASFQTATKNLTSTSGTTDITSNGKTIGSLTLNGSGGTFRLQDALNCGSNTLTLSAGSFNMNGKNSSMAAFSSSNSSTRSITFGGTMSLTGTGTVYTTSNAVGLTTTNTSGTVDVTNSSATGKTVIGGGGVSTALPNLKKSAGTDTFTTTSVACRDLDFTGFSGSWAAAAITVVGNVTLGSGMTVTGGNNVISFRPEDGLTSTITCNGKVLDRPLTINAQGSATGSVKLIDALDIGSHVFTLSQGGLDMNGQDISSASFTAANSIRSITYGGIWTLTGSGTVWDMGGTSFLTVSTASGTIKLTDSSATDKTFVGRGASYPNLWNATGSTGAVVITGSNTFKDIKVDAGRTQKFANGTTTTLSSLTVPNSVANGITITSDDNANTFTLSKASGTVQLYGCTISWSTVTGGARWVAYTNDGNVDGGHNTGWIFADAPVSTNLVLTAVAPDFVQNYIRGPPAADLVLSTSAPESVADISRSPASANLTLSTSAPSIIQAAFVEPLSANLILTTSVPDLIFNFTIEPLSADIVLSSSAPTVSATFTSDTNISVPSGNLVLTASVPECIQAVTISPTTGNLILTASAPENVQNINSSPIATNLLLSTFAIDRVQNTVRSPLASNLVLTTSVPDILFAQNVIVASGNLTLSTFAPTIAQTTNASFAVPTVDLALTASAPNVDATVGVAIPFADLALSTFAPTVAWTNNRSINPSSADLSLSTSVLGRVSDAIRDIPSANLTLTTGAPDRRLGITLSPITSDLALSAAAPTAAQTFNISASPASVNLALSSSLPTLVQTDNHLVGVPARDLALSAVAPIYIIGAASPILIEIPTALLELSPFKPLARVKGPHAPGIKVQSPGGAINLGSRGIVLVSGNRIPVKVPSNRIVKL